MTIKQKAREIAEAAYDPWDSGFQMRVGAAEAGIIEGVQMAAAVVHSEGHEGLATAIRALIEEQKV